LGGYSCYKKIVPFQNLPDRTLELTAKTRRVLRQNSMGLKVKVDSFEKFDALCDTSFISNLSDQNRSFLRKIAGEFYLSTQDILNLAEWTTDFEMWNSGSLESIWNTNEQPKLQGKKLKQALVSAVRDHWLKLKESLPAYAPEPAALVPKGKIKFSKKPNNDTVLGLCPVFSDKTRCCNLQTLDAVMNCGYECTYCSIQSFYHGEEIIFQDGFAEKLQRIEIDPNKRYHIGTGQSSDSLLWGNKNDVLKHLFDWVSKHPNVILELKTKSANIHYLLDNPVPRNVIVTWSLNADTIVKNEEHRSAPLHARLSAARKVADQGTIVGFHFHPIVAFQGWKTEYPKIVEHLVEHFDPEEVALISMGTLTFIKPVMKKLRERKVTSKILQMPFEDAAGKTSYPIEIKRELFSTVYNCFKPWHEKVFFYLCMEDPSLWPDVFGFDYEDNNAFEKAMKDSYMAKVKSLNSNHPEQIRKL
jgi:spore photoproduct lyase